MSVSNIDRDTALRIALAARTMPDIDLATLIGVLNERLARLWIWRSSPALRSPTSRQVSAVWMVRKTVRTLAAVPAWNRSSRQCRSCGVRPPMMTTCLRSLPMPRVGCPALSAALAPNSGENLDGHFGSCLRYLIYQVSDSEIRLVDIRSALEADYAEDRNAFRANMIKDCQVLYVVSIGGPVTCKVIRADVWPMKKTEGGPAGDVLQGVQVAMQGPHPSWPAKIMGVVHEKRLKLYTGVE